MKKNLIVALALIFLNISLMACSKEKESNSSEVYDGAVTTSTEVSMATEPTTTEPTTTEPTTEEPTAEETTVEAPKQAHVVVEKIHSEAIAKNVIDDSVDQYLYIYLPPTYLETTKDYPVIYYFHGYGETPGNFVNGENYFEKAMMTEGNKEFIVVEVDGSNKYYGSFYANSAVTGNWEDYVVDEVVPFVDTHYRTLAQASSRGISGFSMGGFGATNLSLKHPDVFSALYVVGPGLLAENGLEEAMASWATDPIFKVAYGCAFSPNVGAEKPYAIPKMDGSQEDAKIVADWENGFGNLEEKLEDYQALDTPLTALSIKYGKNDSYRWIPKGCEYFSELLTEKGIEHDLVAFNGGHTFSTSFIAEDYIPFFTKNLITQ